MTVREQLDQNKKYIVSAYGEGVSACQIGRDVGINDASIYNFLQNVCMVEMRKQPKISDYQDDIIKLHSDGLSCSAISKQLGINMGTCYGYCRKLNLDLSKHSKHRKVSLKSQASEIIADYKSGMGCTKLAKKYGTYENNIGKLLRKNGIDVLYQKIYNIPHSFFDEIDTEQKAYILGFFAADGCNTNTNKFEIAVIDKNILYKIRDAMGYDGPISERQPKNPRCQIIYKLCMHSKQICKRMTELGCPKKKTFKTTMPQLQENLINHYVRGLSDGDGSIYQSNGYWQFTLAGTHSLLISIQAILAKDNITSFIYEHGNIYILRVARQDDLARFGQWLYKDSTIYLKRKYDRFRCIIN